VSSLARSQVPFIGRSGWARRCPGRGLGMAMTWSSAISSGWAGRGSVGRGFGLLWKRHGALAWSGDGWNSGEQYDLR
jgi:hypothetical protein